MNPWCEMVYIFRFRARENYTILLDVKPGYKEEDITNNIILALRSVVERGDEWWWKVGTRGSSKAAREAKERVRLLDSVSSVAEPEIR